MIQQYRAIRFFIGMITILTVIAAVGCGDKEPATTAPNTPPEVDPQTVPEMIEIDGVEFTLSTYLWRDFMPITDENGRELAAVVYVATADSSMFPSDISADLMWVYYKNDIWGAALENGSQPDYNFRIKKSANGGPKWETGILVDVVVRLIDDEGKYFYIKETDAVVERTE